MIRHRLAASSLNVTLNQLFPHAHLNKHFDTCYSLEGKQQKRHERQPLALWRLLETGDDSRKLHVGLPVERHTSLGNANM